MSVPKPRYDRAAQLRKDLDFLESRLSNPSTILVPVWREQHFLLGDSQLLTPTLREGGELLERGGELVFLGLQDEAACFAVDMSRVESPLTLAPFNSLGASINIADMRAVLLRLAVEEAELAFHARALLNWHARAQFCGVCGEATKPRDGGHMRVCPRSSCRAEHFPRTDPCVLALVTHDDHVLLGRQPGWPRGMYSALAGFVEPGETLEEAVMREVAEETGVALHVDSLRYAGSQPWPFPASLMLGFHARARSADMQRGEELEDARWVSRAELDVQHENFFVPPPRTLAGQLIAQFIAEKPHKQGG
jgi:NAD+ diphosphatase